MTTVSVPVPWEDEESFSVTEVSNSGLALGSSGLGLGYNLTSQVSIPRSGGIYVQVQTEEQLEAVLEVIRNHPNPAVCLVLNSANAPASP